MNEKKIPKITLVSASVFGKWLTEGISEIYQEMGKIFDFKIFFLNDVDSGKISREEFVQNVYNSEIMLLDIRGNCPTVEILVENYSKMEKENPKLFENKTIVALVGGNSEIRRLTKMGPFLATKCSAVWNEDDFLNEGIRSDFPHKSFKARPLLGFNDGLLGLWARWIGRES
jgi:hypothetical protein